MTAGQRYVTLPGSEERIKNGGYREDQAVGSGDMAVGNVVRLPLPGPGRPAGVERNVEASAPIFAYWMDRCQV